MLEKNNVGKPPQQYEHRIELRESVSRYSSRKGVGRYSKPDNNPQPPKQEKPMHPRKQPPGK